MSSSPPPSSSRLPVQFRAAASWIPARAVVSAARPEGPFVTLAPWLAAFFIALWMAAFVVSSTGQWGDNLEQFVWAHSYEWGYHKHPPLPTWLLAALVDIGGPSRSLAVGLAAVCTAATAWFTYRVAQRLLGNPWALLALLMWGLQQAFSTRATLFNHNTVMMLAVAVTVWSVLRALDSPRQPAWWIGCGLAAGAAMLSKYQAIVPLGGVVLAIALCGEFASPAVRRGVLVAAVTATLAILPHLAWVVGHDFSTVEYASQGARTLSLPDRAWTVTSFLAQQVRLLFPALLFAGLLVIPRGVRALVATKSDASARRRRAWFIGLIAFPLIATVLVAPVMGLKLQNHWGFQCLQFVSLYFAYLLRRAAPASIGTWVALALVMHLVFIAVGTINIESPRAQDARDDARFPALQLAKAVDRGWRDTTLCPMRIVIGPSFEAGIVSVYNGGAARVLEDGDFRKSPWITAADVERDGAVHVATDMGRLPTKGVSIVESLELSGSSPAAVKRIFWAIVPPQGCEVKVVD